MRRHLLLTLLLATVLSASAQSQSFSLPQPKREVRAVWLTTIGGLDWPHSYAQSDRSIERQKRELLSILDSLQKLRINTLLVQTRVRATTIYPSALEPWDGCLSGHPGKSPGYDALQYAIEEGHKRGMEVHAWVVTIPVGKWDALGCRTLRRKYPGMIRRLQGEGYMNPEDSRTAGYLASICAEITRHYDIDGIHLDYIRYPEQWPAIKDRELARRNITNIVRRISETVKKDKPWVKLSCSPVGKHDDLSRYWSHGWNARTKVCQDAQAWLRDGLMDALFPMMYFRDEQFYPFAIDWQEQAHGRIVAPGLGIYFLDPKEGKWSIDDIRGELYHLRSLGLGHAMFRCKFLLDNVQGVGQFLGRDFNLYPALVPAMQWQSKRLPQPPADLSRSEGTGYVHLQWTEPKTYEDGTPLEGPHIYYNVYASQQWPVDTSDPSHLVVARTMDTSLTLRQPEGTPRLYFAVCTMDAYGNESHPAVER